MFDNALLSLPRIRRILGILGLLSIVKAAAIISQVWTLATAIANLWAGGFFSEQTPLVAGFFLSFTARQAAVYAQDALLSRYAREQGESLRAKLLDSAFLGSVGWVREHGTASVATAALDGIAQVENYLGVILPKIIDAGVIVPVTLVATLLLDWPSAIILAIVVPVIIFYMVMLGHMAQERAESQYATYQVLSNHFIDTLRGLPTLKALGAGKRQIARIFKVSESFRRATVKTLRVATLSGAVLDLLATLGVAAVAMMLGFRLVVGNLDLCTGLAALMLAPEYFAPLRQFAGDFHASLDGKNALADILALTVKADEHVEDASIEPWSSRSHLAFDGLSFAYAPDDDHEEPRTVLDRASFEATGFERIGIIGASGSGKSTLASLIGGFHAPDAGSLSIDGASVSLRALQSRSWRDQVLYIPQNPYIFHASLRDNIAFYTPDASDDDIAHAMEAVGLEPLVQELPDGLDTVIGEGGRGLSGGQAQRIALARALLDPTRRILIFDEPTAHLDIETELELKQRMIPLMEGRLVIFATHRMHWVDTMDRVYEIDGGMLVEREMASHEQAAPATHQRPTVPGNTAPKRMPGSKSPETPATPPDAKKDRWVRPYFWRYRSDMAKALGLGVAALAFAALLMFTAGYLISGTAEARGSILFYYLPIAFVQLFGLGKPVLRYFERLHAHNWVFRLTSSLRARLYKVLEGQQPKAGHRSVGEVLGLIADDIGHIQNLYLRTVFPLIVAWCVLALATIAFGMFDPLFALVALACMAVAACALPALVGRLTQKPTRLYKSLRDALYESLTDDMLGAADWVFSGRGHECAEALSRDSHAEHDAKDRLDRAGRLSTLAASILLAAFNCLVLWWAAGCFGGTPGGTANWIAAFALGLFPLMESFTALPEAALQANSHRVSIEHLNEFPETDDSIDVVPTPVPKTRSNDLVVSNLAFSYGSSAKTVLDGITLEIPAGQRLAILGPSGSGKSTFAALLRGELPPTRGDVALGGVPTSAFGDAIAQCIGVVQQDPYLFNRSVRENLLIAQPDATDEQIWAVLEQVQLADMIRGLPRGLATMMDEAGMRFSGGERHRIALARVLLADTPIILLDEPTVGLDPDTEHDVLDTLLKASESKTLILITHHLQGIETFDRVLFLEDGRIELDGSPAELARTNDRYQQLLSFDRAS